MSDRKILTRAIRNIIKAQGKLGKGFYVILKPIVRDDRNKISDRMLELHYQFYLMDNN